MHNSNAMSLLGGLFCNFDTGLTVLNARQFSVPKYYRYFRAEKVIKVCITRGDGCIRDGTFLIQWCREMRGWGFS